MATTFTKKQLFTAIVDADPETLAALFGDKFEDAQAVASRSLDTIAKAAARPKTPSKDTLRNNRIKDDIFAELSARGGEHTATEIAEFMTDPDGFPMTSRKVGALLSAMVRDGRVVKSPEKWATTRYAVKGYDQWEPKPVRKAKKKDEENAEE